MLRREQRETRRRIRRQERHRERRRQRIQLREFIAALVALAAPDVEPFTEDPSGVDLEGGQGSRQASAGTSRSSWISTSSSGTSSASS